MLERELSKWLSDNPAKAWAERIFLAYSLVWIAAVAAIVVSGTIGRWNDPALLALGLVLMLPNVLVPAALRGGPERTVPFWQTYWLKLNVWIAIVAWVGSYFGTHFFFAELGMRYAFPATWHLESELMRRAGHEVPVFLYLLAHTYFVTYYTLLGVALRRVRRAFGLGRLGTVVAAVVLCYAVAFAETFFMATRAMSDWFWYVDRSRMLALGSVAYGLVFLVTLPFVLGVDERPGERRPLSRVVVDAVAAGMLSLVVLDGWALLLGPIHGAAGG